MRVCILIPTYKRNQFLQRLLNSFSRIFRSYRGSTTFAIIVTDSDRSNPAASRISSLKNLTYVLNPGSGFDANMYHCYTSIAPQFDYIFSISDDDLPLSYPPSILDLIDMAVMQDQDAFLFNNIDYSFAVNGGGDGLAAMGGRHYRDLRLCYDKKFLLHYFLKSPPRHAGILYSSSFVSANLGTIEKFQGTQHLYAVPLLLACLGGRLIYIDTPAVLFHVPDVSNDGAWESHEEVFFGMYRFLKTLKQILPRDLYAIASEGFFANYLGEASWLRSRLTQCRNTLPNEQDLRQSLESQL